MSRSANVSKWIKQLAEWYANDPNPAIQSACGWLLWHWDEDPLAEFVVRTPLAYDPQRERFLTEVKYGEDDNAEKDYFTFIVFPPERGAFRKTTQFMLLTPLRLTLLLGTRMVRPRWSRCRRP